MASLRVTSLKGRTAGGLHQHYLMVPLLLV